MGIMLIGIFKLLTVWLPLLAICWRWLPLNGPGRAPFCLGLSGLWSLFLTGALMWASLVLTGQILPWLPFGLIFLAFLVAFSVRAPRSEISSEIPHRERVSSVSRAITIGLTVLILVRLASLLPDVALRPLSAWDAWVVWAYEARVWFEAGRYVEFLPPQEWLTAPSEAWVRMTTVEYPRLIPSLILWMAMADGAWSGVGPGLLWWAAAVFVTVMLFGLLRLLGLSVPWALAGAYIWSSLPTISAHVALYGYADLWMAAAFASFVAGLLLATRSGGIYGWLLTALSLLVMPLIKVEGTYWLLVGVFAVVLGGFRPSIRELVFFMVFAVMCIWLSQRWGWDVLQWITQGRLGFNIDDWSQSLQVGVRHAFLWFDWHLLFYLAMAAIVASVYRPSLVEPFLTLTIFTVLAITLLWAVTPLTQAGAWLSEGRLFSRVSLHISPLLSIFSLLVAHQLWREYSARRD